MGAHLNREHILAVLHDMAMVVGAEVRVEPLLRRTLQRLLYHTSFPVGLALLEPAPREAGRVEALLAVAIGDWALVGQAGRRLTLPAALLEGPAGLVEGAPALLAAVPGLARRHACCLRLPVEGQGVLLLLAPEAPQSSLPLGSVFQPVMANLARGIVLCRAHEAQARALTAERDESQAMLRQAQKLEPVARLAGGVAHDFNNLLTAILGAVDSLLRATPPDDPRLEDVRDIEGAAQRAAALTRQLLAFSRKTAVAPAVLDLGQSVAGMAKLVSRLIGEDVRLETRVAPALPPVVADAGQVEQVILNLAVNARDAMPGGGRIVIGVAASQVAPEEAATHPGASAGPHVVLSVSDTGAGIPPEVRAHLFEPFFTTKEQGKGTGLGLSTVYGIVRQAGGHLRVESAPGQGSRFEAWFPAAPGASAGGAAPRGADTPRPGGTAARILLVEDEEAVRAQAVRALTGAGYRVEEAGEAASAEARAAEAGPFDLLVTDLVLPGPSGGELAVRLRARQPGLKVLFMTGYAEQGLPPEPDGRAARCLQKPFAPPALLEAVAAALRG